jgi:hypothetical protein
MMSNMQPMAVGLVLQRDLLGGESKDDFMSNMQRMALGLVLQRDLIEGESKDDLRSSCALLHTLCYSKIC